jgi:hypothetical protein
MLLKKGCDGKRSWTIWKYYSRIYVDGLRKPEFVTSEYESDVNIAVTYSRRNNPNISFIFLDTQTFDTISGLHTECRCYEIITKCDKLLILSLPRIEMSVTKAKDRNWLAGFRKAP